MIDISVQEPPKRFEYPQLRIYKSDLLEICKTFIKHSYFLYISVYTKSQGIIKIQGLSSGLDLSDIEKIKNPRDIYALTVKMDNPQLLLSFTKNRAVLIIYDKYYTNYGLIDDINASVIKNRRLSYRLFSKDARDIILNNYVIGLVILLYIYGINLLTIISGTILVLMGGGSLRVLRYMDKRQLKRNHVIFSSGERFNIPKFFVKNKDAIIAIVIGLITACLMLIIWLFPIK